MNGDTESGKMWAKISEMDKKIAVHGEMIKNNAKNVEDLVKKKSELMKHQFEDMRRASDRSNNIKVAIIGAIAVCIPSIIVIVARGVGI